MAKDPFEDLKKTMGDSIFNSMDKLKNTAAIATSSLQNLKPIVKSGNHAEWMYTRLGEYIQDFEDELDEEHEIGARLVSFGQEVIFHIENVGYYGPDIISFDGISDKGEKVQLIQHISQLSVLLVAMKKLKDEPRRIGFLWDKKDDDEADGDK